MIFLIFLLKAMIVVVQVPQSIFGAKIRKLFIAVNAIFTIFINMIKVEYKRVFMVWICLHDD